MGNEQSVEDRIEEFVSKLSHGADMRVNRIILKFCSHDSSAALRRHYETRKMEAGDCAPDWIKTLVNELGAFTSAPQLAGLGALAVCIVIDILSFSPPEKSTQEALRCVFAEEKASEIWDQIDECLKRYRMHIKDSCKLRSDLERIEGQLSTALTKLKNSMLRDGHMKTETLKAWVNGAAFHIQMLIELVSLGGFDTCDHVKILLSTYENDLKQLFTEHKVMVAKKCRYKPATYNKFGGAAAAMSFLVDEDSKRYQVASNIEYVKYFEAYYDYRYGRQQDEVHKHFSDVRENLQSLVGQRGSLNFS